MYPDHPNIYFCCKAAIKLITNLSVCTSFLLSVCVSVMLLAGFYSQYSNLVKVSDSDYDVKKKLTNERPVYAVIDQ